MGKERKSKCMHYSTEHKMSRNLHVTPVASSLFKHKE